MRQSMTIRLDEHVLAVAKIHASNENRTLTNYIETLIKTDISSHDQNKKVMLDLAEDVTLSVFMAEPLNDRMITAPRDGDTQADVAERQEYLDIITGWNNTKDE